MGTCELCGLDLLPLCPYEDNMDHDSEDEDLNFEWRQYKVKTRVSRVAKDIHCNKVTPIYSTLKEILRFFKKVLGDFITHNYAT
jgi:hypothetical protein